MVKTHAPNRLNSVETNLFPCKLQLLVGSGRKLVWWLWSGGDRWKAPSETDLVFASFWTQWKWLRLGNRVESSRLSSYCAPKHRSVVSKNSKSKWHQRIRHNAQPRPRKSKQHSIRPDAAAISKSHQNKNTNINHSSQLICASDNEEEEEEKSYQPTEQNRQSDNRVSITTLNWMQILDVVGYFFFFLFSLFRLLQNIKSNVRNYNWYIIIIVLSFGSFVSRFRFLKKKNKRHTQKAPSRAAQL